MRSSTPGRTRYWVPVPTCCGEWSGTAVG
jgi:hypothetical protein